MNERLRLPKMMVVTVMRMMINGALRIDCNLIRSWSEVGRTTARRPVSLSQPEDPAPRLFKVNSE